MAVKISDPVSEINLHAPFPRASRRIASIPRVHPSPARLFLDGFTKTPLHIHEGKWPRGASERISRYATITFSPGEEKKNGMNLRDEINKINGRTCKMVESIRSVQKISRWRMFRAAQNRDNIVWRGERWKDNRDGSSARRLSHGGAAARIQGAVTGGSSKPIGENGAALARAGAYRFDQWRQPTGPSARPLSAEILPLSSECMALWWGICVIRGCCTTSYSSGGFKCLFMTGKCWLKIKQKLWNVSRQWWKVTECIY